MRTEIDKYALYGIPPDKIDKVFPFHIVLDCNGGIRQFGPSIHKLFPELETESLASEYFQIETPPAASFDDGNICNHINTTVVIRSLKCDTKLKGELIRIDDEKKYLMMLCTPIILEMGSAKELGLTLNDFAIHDSIMDFLVLLQTKTNTIEDFREMATGLKTEVKTRKKAEAELQLANEELEERVSQRTEELSKANENLIDNIDIIQERNRQISILYDMSAHLQACKSAEETFGIISSAVQELFPDDSGQLYLYSDANDQYELSVQWGATQGAKDSFNDQDCWALRIAKPIQRSCSSEPSTICNHVVKGQKGKYICVPLSVQGKVLGILHLISEDEYSDSNVTEAEKSADLKTKQDLIMTAAEYMSLAIANLRLRETMRAQAIKDVLTGFFNRRYMEEALVREVSGALRHGYEISLILLDIDHFKNYNDTYGHPAGDSILRGLGSFIMERIRKEDIPCRYGGEEFLIILPRLNHNDAQRKAEKIRFDVEKNFNAMHEGKVLPGVTISLGVAIIPHDGKDPAQVIKAADQAMYRAKNNGRNRVVMASSEFEN